MIYANPFPGPMIKVSIIAIEEKHTSIRVRISTSTIYPADVRSLKQVQQRAVRCVGGSWGTVQRCTRRYVMWFTLQWRRQSFIYFLFIYFFIAKHPLLAQDTECRFLNSKSASVKGILNKK